MEKKIYFILGGPGAGKGTFCKKLTELDNNKFQHFSAGDLLRACKNENSENLDKEK